MLPIPGLTKDMKQMLSHTGEGEMKKIQSIINSMTVKERQQPDLIKSTRLTRIAKGCGKTEQDIKQFLQQFEMMQAMMKQMGQFMPGGAPGAGGKKPKHPILMMPRQKRPRF
jgi:signal recognition particle subunit SRP54